MAGKQVGVEGLSANFAGMSKNQLYDIMSQMKNLIEQNQQQARQILIQNPMLTKALFQAQIMLGMVQPPQVVPKVQPMVSQNNHQSVQPTQQPNIQPAPLLPGHGSAQDQAGVSQTQIPLRKHQNQPSVPVSSAAGPAMSHQSQPIAAHSLQMPQQPKGHMTPQVAPASLPQSSQLPNILPSSLHSSSQPLHPTQMSTASSQLQQPLQAPGFPHMPLQPPLPQQVRQPAPTFHPQYPPQMGANLGFKHAGASHNLPQSMFHPGAKPPASVGSTFPQGQTPLPSQQSSQSPYQVGNMPLGPDFGNQAGNAMQIDRGSSWMAGPSENLAHLSGPPGPPSLVSGQMGAVNQPLRPPGLTAEMEKALLQQVMSLTPEQINLLPPEQRNQVLQLQQMLRQ
ncbi:Cleavage stimulating factor 64 [Mucuna pruriens]|uniref:Cleavage stimulating factor 64 n=1 Tax=Mucuna pruriens TaxID=157652 RepID=A0A371I7S5_MUCPR|nr:Cleavage stimulating factor 64 [Mucuna pruriens]